MITLLDFVSLIFHLPCDFMFPGFPHPGRLDQPAASQQTIWPKNSTYKMPNIDQGHRRPALETWRKQRRRIAAWHPYVTRHESNQWQSTSKTALQCPSNSFELGLCQTFHFLALINSFVVLKSFLDSGFAKTAHASFKFLDRLLPLILRSCKFLFTFS